VARDLLSLDSYQYDLPKELIAQQAAEPRNSSRLLVIDRRTGNFQDLIFRDLADMLAGGDSLVLNDTKVIPARLFGQRPSGGKVEVVLLRQKGNKLWAALVRPGRKLGLGEKVIFSEDFFGEIIEIYPDGSRLVEFHCKGDFFEVLEKVGHLPLPQYIQRADDLNDKERYQTVYAANSGAVAAPTAGLHFTSEMLAQLENKGVSQTCITLHVGLGTFRPVQVADIRQHVMHTEPFFISEEAANSLNIRQSAKKQICIGTTCCRALESAVDKDGRISPGIFETDIFLYPGCEFKYVQSLLTNFHLPGSTLLMLVCAFGGYELMMEAYAKAVKDRYRFFSYGDAMLIL
jgi:S-adenosylmethionine:tRNA ribosyltransferase-isomerase